MWNRILAWPTATRASVLAIVGFAVYTARAAELAENLSDVTSGAESVTTTRWLAAAFKTDASANRLTAVTLLLANTSPGTAALDLYSDGGLEPGNLVATLTSPGSYSSTMEETTFSANSVELSADATHWVVLRALSGAFDWGWTADNAGTGAGFVPTWDCSEDTGAAWYTHDVYPLQLRITVTATEPITDCNKNGIADAVDIANGSFADANGNGVPDVCEDGFLRGDCNDDRNVDISDAVSTLGALFLGEGTPGCLDACDSNDDGTVDISDAIATLGVLFLGQGAIPLPGTKDCGVDPTDDQVDCKTFERCP